MLNVAVFLSSIICCYSVAYIVNRVLTNQANDNIKKHILFIIIISLITYFSYIIKYDSESVVLKIALYILVFNILYNNSMYKSTIMILTSMAIISASDMITSLIFIQIITSDQVRSIWYWLIICNIIVSIISIIIANIQPLKSKLRNTIEKTNENSKKSTILVLIMSILVVTYTFYNISNNYNWSDKYIINIIVQVTYFIIIFIFFKDKLQYDKLMKKYDSLFEFFKEYEDSIDDIYLINHEHKNQIAIIKEYLKNSDLKEAKGYIDNILENDIEDKMDIIKNLRYIPKGGIKGLLYYKIVCAKNKNTAIVLDVDRNVVKKLKLLDSEQNKIISKILGVYIDNAIEAVEETHKKIVNIEIYLMNEEINIVISNSFNKHKVDISKISNNGYSTKGQGHGKGTYLIKRLINKTKWCESSFKVINNYYVQRIIIK